MRRRFSQNFIQILKTACVNPKHIILLICAGHSERWIAHTAWRYSPAPLNPRGWWSQLTAAKLHGTSPRGEQSSTEAVTEVQMDDRKDKFGPEIATTKGNVTASWRQRNLRSGWRARQYELTTSLRQRWRRAISQWIGVILYGFRLGPQWAFPMRKSYAALSYLWKRTREAWMCGFVQCCRPPLLVFLSPLLSTHKEVRILAVYLFILLDLHFATTQACFCRDVQHVFCKNVWCFYVSRGVR